ncbi:hypothetical protein MHK_010905 [Candidatus Magnetomorum sp. HK-1]|nr:hypothetical protein MHK_010905 [Candidatus Magnetomorum sp. HK-1]
MIMQNNNTKKQNFENSNIYYKGKQTIYRKTLTMLYFTVIAFLSTFCLMFFNDFIPEAIAAIQEVSIQINHDSDDAAHNESESTDLISVTTNAQASVEKKLLIDFGATEQNNIFNENVFSGWHTVLKSGTSYGDIGSGGLYGGVNSGYVNYGTAKSVFQVDKYTQGTYSIVNIMPHASTGTDSRIQYILCDKIELGNVNENIDLIVSYPRVVIRGDGGFPTWTKRDPEVGFTVYNSKDVSVQNMIIVDRLLVTEETMRYPYADFATAQHTGENIESPLENNEWLGCLSINSEDNGFYLESDNSLSPTYQVNNCATVGLTDAHFGFNLVNGIDSIIENSTVIRNNGVGTFFRHAPDASIGQTTRNVIGIGPANSAIINGGDTLGNEIPCEIYNKCEPEPKESANYFIATDGNDINNGSNASPWVTFAHAFTVLQPGDTLIIKDGSYHEQINPTISGTPGNPITIAAENTGGVIIEMLEDGSAVEIYSNTDNTISYITIEGIIARGHGEHSAINVCSADNVNEAQMTNNIVIRKTGAFGSANLRNCEVFGIGNNVRDSLFEDIWAYGFGRKALIAFGCKRVTVRRAVLRHDYWDGSEYKPNDPRSVFSGYNTQDSIFENIIAIDAAPTPEGRSSDRSCIIASGNETPALISGSENNKYLGIIALNNIGNGFKVNGGTGDPAQNIYFKDILAWNNTGYGMVVENNANDITIFNGTFGNNRTGLKIEQYASLPITNASITNSFAFNNTYSGFLYNSDQMAQFELNTSTQNGSNNFDSEHAPTMNYIVQPEMVEENDRGAIIINRYIDGNLTEESLWPWPNEDLIKQHMCNPADLTTVNRVAENGPGWEPGWCADDKTLTQYIWEYLGNEIPCEIYNSCEDGKINLTDAILVLQIVSKISVATDIHKFTDIADINDDGIINLVEAVYFLQYISNK